MLEFIPNILESGKKKRQNRRATKHSYTHSPHTHCKMQKPPNRGSAMGTVCPSSRWKPVSHFIITPRIPPRQAGLLGEASSFTAVLKHRIVNTNPQQDLGRRRKKDRQIPTRKRPQREDSTTLALLNVYLLLWQMNKPITIIECCVHQLFITIKSVHL